MADGNWVNPRAKGLTTTGVDANGYSIVFPMENSPFNKATITFFQQYIRMTGNNQFAQNTDQRVSPETGVFAGNGNAYQIGQTTELGVNEAAALVARGIAEYS